MESEKSSIINSTISTTIITNKNPSYSCRDLGEQLKKLYPSCYMIIGESANYCSIIFEKKL